jgi:hypothetical protein
MAIVTTWGVVGGSQSIIEGFDLVEDELVVLERAVRNRRRPALIYGRPFGAEPIEQIVVNPVVLADERLAARLPD